MNAWTPIGRMLRLLAFVLTGLSALMLGACATTGELTSGFNAAAKVQELRQGMSQDEVRSRLGSPTAVRILGTAQVWRYSLHQNWKGWVPYYLVFAGADVSLREWYADEAEYQSNQAALERRWAPVVNSLNRNSGTAPATGNRGGASRSGAESDDCKNARTFEDRVVYCHGVNSDRVMR